MDIAQLAVLRELAERGSITGVAAALHKTPSAVSQQLKTLQRQVGVPLVVRVGRGVQLTDAGRALASSSVRVATAIAEAEATWEAYRGDAYGTVRVSAFSSAAELLLAGLITRLSTYPGIDLAFEDQDVAQDGFAALTADHDIVIAHRSDDIIPPGHHTLSVVPLLREPIDVALPLDHPLGTLASVSPEDVIREPWIGVPKDYPIDRVLSAMAARVGVEPHVAYRTTSFPIIEKLVAAGHGIALLPRNTALPHAPGNFRLVPLADLRAGRRVEALLRPDRAARRAVRVVLDALVTEAQSRQ
jgi:DNA-binding transcriptional LysR family regulator